MGRALRMPSEAELPPGTVRDLVEFLFEEYRLAGRPTLRKISDAVASGDYKGTASTETVRRMLHGKSVPARWEVAGSVFLALCDLAGRDPEEPCIFQGTEGHRDSTMKRLWNAALDEPDRRWGAPNPWSDGDELPF